MDYLARTEAGLLVVFQADCEDDAVAICEQEGWIYDGRRAIDDDYEE